MLYVLQDGLRLEVYGQVPSFSNLSMDPTEILSGPRPFSMTQS